MKNGIIYTILKFILDNLKYLSLVEFFKYSFLKLFSENSTSSKIKTSRIAVDTFIILKWGFIIIAMNQGWNNTIITIFVWYLVYSNLYTYFYYHIWIPEALNTENFEIDRIRRRFITLMLSIGFSNLCFAFLVRYPYLTDFQWSENIPLNIKATWFSFANSLTANYEYVKPITKDGVEITITQLIVSFIFLTLILGKSIPQTNSTR